VLTLTRDSELLYSYNSNRDRLRFNPPPRLRYVVQREGKGKLKLFPCFNRAPRIGGVEVQLHAFLTSALDGGERSASRPIYHTKWKEMFYPHLFIK